MDYINILLNTGLSQVVLILFAAIFVLRSCVEVIDWLLCRFGIKTKSALAKEGIYKDMERLKKADEQADKKFTAIESTLDKLMIASRESLAYKINEKYRKYLHLGYIPSDELGEFMNLHDAYQGVGGNHSGDAKFDYCVNNLEVKDEFEREFET